jgi:2-polyprenyl-6-hydroxyphenyl methylase/3-demethylubiquinone-9 3-methyltransferase
MSDLTSPSVHANRREFVEYYADKSTRPETIENFRTIRAAILTVLGSTHPKDQVLDVVDVGCNAGTQCALWAELGHRVHGLDISQPLLELAKERASASGHAIDFRLGTATELPWSNESMDVCIALELLEHVAEWRRCLKEFARVLRPGGVMFLSTTNALCPKQDEFNLPAYSWYPGPFKRYFERLATTTRPDLANHAKFPAINWFNPYGLKAELRKDGFSCLDRFDLVDLSRKGLLVRFLVRAIRAIPLLRGMGFICTNGTMVLGVKLNGHRQ